MTQGPGTKTLGRISVIVPLLDEGPGLEELFHRIREVLSSLQRPFEVIFVDDGSHDDSFRVLAQLHRLDSRARAIRFRKNFGKAAALMAGFKQARGDIIITLDADLQDLPEEIPKLLEQLDKGYDLVSGWKVERRDPWTRRLASWFFNRIVAVMTGIRIHDFNSGFKCYRSEVTKEIRLHGELHRYIPVLAAWRGFRVGEVPVDHHPRRYGHSKYGSMRAFRGFFDLITVMALTRFSRRPLHLFGLLGFALAGTGSAISFYLSLRWLMGQWLGNRPLFLTAIMLIVIGVQLVFFGLLAEMIGYATNREAPYAIREQLMAEDRTDRATAAADGSRLTGHQAAQTATTPRKA